MKRELAGYAADARTFLGRYTPQARQMLRKLLDGKKITLTPVEIPEWHVV